MDRSVRVDLAEAKAHLERAWSRLEDAAIVVPDSQSELIRQVLTARDKTFKYILITGLLGKLTNPGAHPRALQKSSELVGAYDARSLCHSAVVPFEKTRGDLFGLSNEPFLSKPARHPEHSKDNRQLRNRRLAVILHQILDEASVSDAPRVEAMLIASLRIARDAASSQMHASIDKDLNLHHVIRFVEQFLKKSDGGARLVAVAGAFVRLLSERFVVKCYPPSASDAFGETAGDIEVYSEELLCFAYECKQRAVTLNDIHHGIRKARERKVPEYCFLYSEGLVDGEREAIRSLIDQAFEEMDISLVEFNSAFVGWGVVLNPVRRARFGETVVSILRDEMRRSGSANEAAELWDSLE